MDKKKEIIKLFDKNVRGKRPETIGYNQEHDGKSGHWLEAQMGVTANASNSPDLYGYEMKNHTRDKTTWGDWSASYYIFKPISGYNINKNEFLHIFGKPNLKKEGRYSWSGEPCPKIGKYNNFGQILKIDSNNNILAIYSFSNDARKNKLLIVPKNMQIEGLVLAKWDAEKLKNFVENKFNQSGWFKCLKNKQGVYTSIVFGAPVNYKTWLNLVRTKDIFLDSGMNEGTSRNRSEWRSSNSVWEKLIESQH